jgi:hypothetical protein
MNIDNSYIGYSLVIMFTEELRQSWKEAKPVTGQSKMKVTKRRLIVTSHDQC